MINNSKLKLAIDLLNMAEEAIDEVHQEAKQSISGYIEVGDAEYNVINLDGEVYAIRFVGSVQDLTVYLGKDVEDVYSLLETIEEQITEEVLF